MLSQNTTAYDSIPPSVLVLLAVVSIQVGSGFATFLFPVLGAEGTVAIRIIISALILSFAARGRLGTFVRIYKHNWQLLFGFALCIAVMNIFFYKSIALIPLGAAVAIEFMGPLGVAALTSRRFIHFAWIVLAALGVFLLSPFSGTDLNTLGILFALLAGLGWALFIVFAGKVGKNLPGNDGLVIGMIIAAILLLPFAVPVAADFFLQPLILIGGIAVAVFSTTIPFSLEFEALKRMPARTYGILVSAEPAVAALVGALLLGQSIGIQGMIAVACVVVAAIGITLTDGRSKLA